MTRRSPDALPDGFTIIELVASLTVLSIGIFGVMSVMMSSFSVATTSGNRTQAVAVASWEAEKLRAIPYSSVGFETNQPGYAATDNGDATVTLATGEARTTPHGSETVGPRTYTITRSIVWGAATAGTTTYSAAYKKASVAVSWSDRAGAHTARQSTIVYPGGLGPYATTTTTTAPPCGTPSPPTALTAAVPVDIAGSSTVNLTWVPPLIAFPAIASWVIEYSTNNFATTNQVTNTQPPSATAYSLSGLAASTTYQFRVAGKSVCGTVSASTPIASATTTAGVNLDCSYGRATITPSAIKRNNNGSNATLSADAAVVVNTVGPCTGLHLTYQSQVGSTTTLAMTGSNGVWSALVDGTHTGWDIGVHTIALYDGANVNQGGMTLTVCASNARVCG